MGDVYMEKCPVCGSLIKFPVSFYEEQLCHCKNCGDFIYAAEYIIPMETAGNYEKKEKLKKYLLHHNSDGYIKYIGAEEKYQTFLSRNPNRATHRADFEIAENWYPKTFAEQINLVLLYLHNKTSFPGEKLTFTYLDLLDVFLLSANRYEMESNVPEIYQDQILYIRNCLKDLEYIGFSSLACVGDLKWSHKITIQLKPKGFSRIYELNKTQANNKKVFVAMKFGTETDALRAKIKEGIIKAGYEPIIMDEVEHNHQIVPEMLYQIKNSRFVIAELSHHNNGAYYEAGYALGMGKEVIHICKKDELKSGLHFDVAQVNTLVYENIDLIPDLLAKRIKATIF